MTAPAPSTTPRRRDPDQAERLLRRLDWQVIRRLDGLLQGDHRALFYGSGTDFADLREYQTQDDVRYIDWNVTARLDVPYVRQYIDDRELTAWLLLDRSSSMGFGHVDRTKGVVVADLAATLARLLTRDGNRLGAVFYDNAVERVVEPRTGRLQALRLARDLLEPPPGAGASTDLDGLFRVGLQTIRRRSLVFVVSDFISEPGWERALGVLAHRHEVVAVRIWDQREVELVDAGVVVMQDAETGEQLLVDTGDPRFRRRFAARGRGARGGAPLVDPACGCRSLRPLDRRRPRAHARAHGRHAKASASPMTFLAPGAFGFLLLVPVLVVAYVWIIRRRAASEAELGTMAYARHARASPSGGADTSPRWSFSSGSWSCSSDSPAPRPPSTCRAGKER